MKISKALTQIIFIALLTACSPSVTVHGGYQPPVIPITITIDSNGNIQVEWEGSYQTPIGTFSAGVEVNPSQMFPNANGTLTVRINNDEDVIYDLGGNENIDIQLDSGYYKEVNLRKTGKDWLFEAVKISSDSSSGDSSSSNASQSFDDSCGGSLPSHLTVGSYAYVTNDPPINNRVRDGAGLSYKQVGSILNGHSMKILDGPECADGYYWWKVQALRNSSVVGWSAEGDNSTYWLEPCNSISSCP